MAALLGAVLLTLGMLPRVEGISTSASSAILMDASSGRVLYEHRAHDVRLIASITKLMTALVASEWAAEAEGRLDETLTVEGAWLAGAEGSSIYLQPGERISLRALLYGMMLESGNDAALAVACVCAGSVEDFVTWMNGRAATLGMERSHFENPNGLNAEGHHSTAYDMALLARACLNDPLVSAICATRSATFGSRTFTNHNKLLELYEGCIGMKTGYTRKAGRTLVSAAERGGQKLICVTLNDGDDWRDHMALLDHGFAAYPLKTISRAGELFTTLPLAGSLLPCADVVVETDFLYPLQTGESIRVEMEVPSFAEAPVTAGQEAGQLCYYLGDRLIGRGRLVYAQTLRRDVVTPAGGLLQRILSAIFGTEVRVFG